MNRDKVTYSGPAGSGKSGSFRKITSLISSNRNHQPWIIKGIRDSQAILNAFGHVYESNDHFDASKFGKYVEYQYASDGLLSGCKVLDFYLQKNLIYSSKTFHIFKHLIVGATADEAKDW